MALSNLDTAYNHGVDDSIKEADRMSKCVSMSGGNRSAAKMFSEFVAYLVALKKVA